MIHKILRRCIFAAFLNLRVSDAALTLVTRLLAPMRFKPSLPILTDLPPAIWRKASISNVLQGLWLGQQNSGTRVILASATTVSAQKDELSTGRNLPAVVIKRRQGGDKGE